MVSKTTNSYQKVIVTQKMKKRKDYHSQTWQMLPQGTIKLNFDSAYMNGIATVA